MTGWLIVTFKASWFNDALLLSAVSKYSIGGMKAWWVWGTLCQSSLLSGVHAPPPAWELSGEAYGLLLWKQQMLCV